MPSRESFSLRATPNLCYKIGMSTLPDTVETNAAKPRAVTVDGQTVEQHSLKDQIEAAKMAAANDAIAATGNSSGNGKSGLTFFKFRPPGA